MPEGRWLQALGKLPPEEQEEIMGFAGYEKRQPQPNKETPKEKIIKPILVCMKDVETEEVSWLWEPYIPKGKITMLEGDPGLGKTWMALMLTAIVSNGNPFPSSIDGRLGPRRQPETVLYMSAEDGLADTLKPRLEMVGANTTNVHALTGWTDKPEDTDSFMPINLQDINVLREALEQVKPSLVVIDPIQGYMGPGIDMHRANEVRPVLAGIARLAEQHDCAMICIRHLGKSGQDKAIYRGLGSM